jgi:hypothetical protein
MTVVRTDLIPNLFPNRIVGVSKADPAVVSVPVVARIVSTTGTIGTVTGSGTTSAPWTAAITLMSSTVGMQSGDVITATAGTGTFAAGGEVSVKAVTGNQSITINKIGGTIPTAGTVTNITEPAASSLPPFIIDNAIIQITDVEGMTQLATAGASNTSWYYVDVLSGTTFALYRDVGLTTTVDSSAFTTAVANTGQYTTIDTVVITESP